MLDMMLLKVAFFLRKTNLNCSFHAYLVLFIAEIAEAGPCWGLAMSLCLHAILGILLQDWHQIPKMTIKAKNGIFYCVF